MEGFFKVGGVDIHTLEQTHYFGGLVGLFNKYPEDQSTNSHGFADKAIMFKSSTQVNKNQSLRVCTAITKLQYYALFAYEK